MPVLTSTLPKLYKFVMSQQHYYRSCRKKAEGNGRIQQQNHPERATFTFIWICRQFLGHPVSLHSAGQQSWAAPSALRVPRRKTHQSPCRALVLLGANHTH